MKKIILISLIFLIKNNTFADDKFELGMNVFNNKAACGTCHTLQATGSVGNIGPNLDIIKPKIAQVVYAVKNGIGVMPAWEGVLTPEEIEAVAYYVFNSTNK